MDFEPELSEWRMMRVELSVVEGSTGGVLACVVEGSSADGGSFSILRLTAEGLAGLTGEGYDFEEALCVLRTRLEHRGLLQQVSARCFCHFYVAADEPRVVLLSSETAGSSGSRAGRRVPWTG
jgi:hypothetical protein